MASPSQIHDVASGFRDIKQVPEFFPSILPTVLGIIIFSVACALAWYLWKHLQKKNALPIEVPETPADVRALSELKRLEELLSKSPQAVRDTGAGVSFCLRTFVEGLLAIPAQDRTSAELVHDLNAALRAALPSVAAEDRDEYSKKLIALLRQCDRVTFREDSEQVFSNDQSQLNALLTQSREFVRSLAGAHKRELQRRASVLDAPHGKQLGGSR